MTGKGRRDFLRLTAGATSAAAALSLVPESVRKALAIPANNATGTIMDVEHVVIFMQENRSFDHYFGTFDGVRGFGDPRAIRLAGGRSVWHQPSREHPDGYVLPFHGDSATTRAYAVDGSSQGHQDDLTLMNGGKFDRWGHTGELHKRMVYYTARDLPFYHALASAFTICDHYHCSTLTQTYPNRLHLWTGCNGGGKVGGDPEMSNYGEDQTPTSDMAMDEPLANGPLTWTTYAERLEAKGISWKVYQEYDNFQDNILSIFAPFRPADRNSSLYRRGRSWVSEHHPDPDIRKKSTGELLVEAFRNDLASGTLPQVSWIVTAADLSEHPEHVPSKGENVCAKLIEALVDNPEVFSKTAFIINYDENGGFFDHMPPPLPPLYDHQGHSTVSTAGEAKDYGGRNVANPGLQPVGLGVRVPAIIVSPWSRGGWVCSEVFDHTSTLRFLEARFGVREENLSDWRRAVCGDLTSAFDFRTPNRDWTSLALPSTADYLERVARSLGAASLTIPAKQSPTGQRAGQRPARPLPYELHVDGRVEDGAFLIHLANTGRAGAVLQIHDNTGAQGPWRFTIGAGHSHTASQWHARGGLTDYDLSVYGPDGFFRRFRGRLPLYTAARAGAEAEVAYDSNSGKLVVKLTNHGKTPLTFRIAQADIYRVASGEQRCRAYDVAPSATVADAWSLASSDHWYDLSVSVEGHADFLRQFAGRVETGMPGRTDPAISAMVI